MKASELRRRYLEFFGERDHRILPGSPLVPNDPTLLFTSAGMVQFKDVFWGRTASSIPRATTCQKCFRTTDIENVGRTAFHNTFFEMLGNFSFGDYFKEGALRLAWEFLVDELGLPEDRLSVSIYHDDDEVFALWRDVVGLPKDRITRLGKEDNWWGPVGGSGPCGPDSEIFYDTGVGDACGPDCSGVACECNRYSEIWNLVFLEYDASEDGSLAPLDKKNIDTGMGLERTSAVLQGVGSVFESDLFNPIVEAIEAACPQTLSEAGFVHRNSIADHVRAILFLLAEGVMPGNERQGYVLRRILRRAVRAGEKIELPPGSLAGFVEPVIAVLGSEYPEIVKARDLAHRLIAREEETFRRTLRDGERRLTKLLEELAETGEAILPGELAFELMDTYGFPLEMTQEIATERRITVDRDGFDSALSEQRSRSRRSLSFEADLIPVREGEDKPTEFTGHGSTGDEGTIQSVHPSDREGAVLDISVDKTPFYATAGGQVSDVGRIENLSRDGTATVVVVQKNSVGTYLHSVADVTGTFEPGDRCELEVDRLRRARIQRNHTATHLLHAALREILGSHAKQAGSEVNDVELRFDFSHFERMSPEQIAQVEDFANAAVLADHEVKVSEVSLEEAQRLGAIGLFEDEYRGKDRVRVISVGDVSIELCGGTHVSRSGEIGLIKIVSEESIASGVRRVRAITGDAVLNRLRDRDAFLLQLRNEIGEENPLKEIQRLRDELQGSREQLDSLSAARVKDAASELMATAEEIGSARLIGGRVDLSGDQLKGLADALEEKARPAAVLLVGNASGNGIVVCKRSKGLDAIDAGAVMRTVSGALGGGGGGSKMFAQGGGPHVDKLDEALATGQEAIREALS